MREGRPSFTAVAVAAARGIAAIDSLAVDLLPKSFRVAEKLGRRFPRVASAYNVLSLGLIDHVELRTIAIDEALRDGVSAGAEQLVILGAGLDARAWRVPGLGRVVVFEVDHPSTQTYKRARFETRASTAADVRFVAVDFERESLETALGRAGHRPVAKTFWIWEGVTPYLAPDATRATLAVVGARSAPGSRLAVTYATPDGTSMGPAVARVAFAVFRGIGEPIRGLWTTHAIAQGLADVGFEMLDDTAPTEWPGAASRPRILLVHERLAVAEKK